MCNVQSVIKCQYKNNTEAMDIVRGHFLGQWLERVVEAGMDYVFYAPPDADIEIYTYGLPSSQILKDKVRCSDLAV